MSRRSIKTCFGPEDETHENDRLQKPAYCCKPCWSYKDNIWRSLPSMFNEKKQQHKVQFVLKILCSDLKPSSKFIGVFLLLKTKYFAYQFQSWLAIGQNCVAFRYAILNKLNSAVTSFRRTKSIRVDVFGGGGGGWSHRRRLKWSQNEIMQPF